jgi:hypothetical protein
VSGIEITSENASTSAVRDTAEGSKNRTIAGAIKGLFRKVAKAITHDKDEPRPEARRRRNGETEGGFRKLARKIARQLTTARTAAHGRYAALRPVKTEQTPADAHADVGLYLSDTLDWLNLWWQGNTADDLWIGDDFNAKQDQSYPQP